MRCLVDNHDEPLLALPIELEDFSTDGSHEDGAGETGDIHAEHSTCCLVPIKRGDDAHLKPFVSRALASGVMSNLVNLAETVEQFTQEHVNRHHLPTCFGGLAMAHPAGGPPVPS
jgi:hypothetical protein